jgi:hypothetical protein
LKKVLNGLNDKLVDTCYEVSVEEVAVVCAESIEHYAIWALGPGSKGSGKNRARSHCRFRSSGAESLSESGRKWMSGGIKRQCDRTLGKNAADKAKAMFTTFMRGNEPPKEESLEEESKSRPFTETGAGQLDADLSAIVAFFAELSPKPLRRVFARLTQLIALLSVARGPGPPRTVKRAERFP